MSTAPERPVMVGFSFMNSCAEMEQVISLSVIHVGSVTSIIGLTIIIHTMQHSQ